MINTIEVKSTKRIEFIDITDKLNSIVTASNTMEGLCILYVPHTTAGITINENTDSSVIYDILTKTTRLIPPNNNYSHMEGNSDAHIKSSLFGNSLNLIIENSHVLLGTWQGVFFCEFDGPRNRKIYVKILKG